MKLEQPVFPLTLEAFALALKAGHGRAQQQISNHGSIGYEGKITEACLHCLSYDPQCEAERAPWLFAIVDSANMKFEITQAIGDLMRKHPAEDYRDMDQRSAILKQLAAAGVVDARRLLYLSLARLSDTSNVIGSDEIIALDGVDGLIFVARQLGRWLKEDSGFWVDDSSVDQFDESVGAKKGLAALEHEAVADADIAQYLVGLRNTRETLQSPAGNATTAAFTGAQIVAYVCQNPKDQCHWFRSWGMRADAVQREVVFTALLDSQEPNHVQRLLRCFAKVGVPRFDSRLLRWIFHTDPGTRWVVVQAVTKLSHPELREAALQLIADGDLKSGARLLVANFQPGDLSLCAQHLGSLRDVDEYHSHGIAILALCEAHPNPDALICLLHVYENSPCSTCRSDAVRLLVDIGIAPAWLLEESTFDADPETRRLAADTLAISM